MEKNESFAPRFPNLPERIRGLESLVYNLWWSWNRAAREMFRALDLQAWLNSAHNPLRMLAMVSQETLEKAANNPEFLERYDAVMAYFEAEVNLIVAGIPPNLAALRLRWLIFPPNMLSTIPCPFTPAVSAFLAGDYIKECSDLAVPVVAVGLIYSRGYVSQKLRDDGWQEDQENVLDRTWDPVRPVLDENKAPAHGSGAPIQSAGSRAGMEGGYWPRSGVSAGYRCRKQSALGPRDRQSTLHNGIRAAASARNRSWESAA